MSLFTECFSNYFFNCAMVQPENYSIFRALIRNPPSFTSFLPPFPDPSFSLHLSLLLPPSLPFCLCLLACFLLPSFLTCLDLHLQPLYPFFPLPPHPTLLLDHPLMICPFILVVKNRRSGSTQ